MFAFLGWVRSLKAQTIPGSTIKNGPTQVNYTDNFGVPATVNTDAHDFDFSAEPRSSKPRGGSNVGWRTSGTARDGDDDSLVELTFGPGIKTSYNITPGGSNDPDGGGYQQSQ